MAQIEQILDTTVAEAGDPILTSNNDRRQAHVQVMLGSGDTVVIEGRIDPVLDWVVLETFTSSDIRAFDLPEHMRARRTVDGGGADSVVYIEIL